MKIGLLNDSLKINVSSVTYENSSTELALVKNENPVSGGTLSIDWQTARNMPVSVKLRLEKECFVDRAVVSVSNETYLTKVVLKDGKNTLYSYCSETGTTITSDKIVLEAGSVTDNLEFVFEGDFSNIEIEDIRLYGALEESVDLYPTPKEYKLTDGFADAVFFDSCQCEDKTSEKAANVLCEKYFELTAIRINKVDSDGKIAFIGDANIKEDGYKLIVDDLGAKIYASNVRGFVMGAESFIKLVKDGKVAKAEISDEPFCKFRGVHLYIPAYEDLDFTRRLVKYMISPMGYNNIIFNIAGGMEYESHPEINEAVCHANKMNAEGKWPTFPFGSVAGGSYLKKDDIRELLEYIRGFGISIIPEIQSLGHVQYLTQAFPEIAEIDPEAEKKKIDTRAEDAKPNEFYYHSYCPSNPKSYEIMYDIIDEIVELFRPEEYVHMGHDEVYQLAVCPKCKGKDAATLYRNDVMKLYNHLKTKGMKMILWADMIQPVTHYASRPAIDMLPKDILMLDFVWYFWLGEDIELNLTNKGYTVGIGNLYSSHFPRYESRIRHDGVIGGEISTWTPTCEEKIQKEGKFYDILLTAQMLWSKDYASEYTLTYDKIISAMMPYIRQNLKRVKYPSLTDNAVFEIIVENSVEFPPVFPVSQKTSFDVDADYDSIIFSHTELKRHTKMPWAACEQSAEYILTYDDGTQESVPVTNGGNIAYWNRRQNAPYKHPLYRHNGYSSVYYTDGSLSKTADGRDITVYNYEHILRKDKKTVKIELVQSKTLDTNVFLCKATGVKEGK